MDQEGPILLGVSEDILPHIYRILTQFSDSQISVSEPVTEFQLLKKMQFPKPHHLYF